MEVVNLFSGLLTQQGLSRIDKARDHQAIVPDFWIVLPKEGSPTPVLHKLKCISANRTRYLVTQAKRAVDKRAEDLHDEYVSKAQQADQLYGLVEEGRQGRVERKLLSFPKVEGLVFGNWGEASESVHSLVEHLATSRARVGEPQARSRGGRLSEEGIKSVAVGYIRRRLSIAAIKAQCLTLLGRLEVMGPGAVLANNRRKTALEQYELWRRERCAQIIADKQGYNAVRRGFAKLD